MINIFEFTKSYGNLNKYENKKKDTKIKKKIQTIFT